MAFAEAGVPGLAARLLLPGRRGQDPGRLPQRQPGLLPEAEARPPLGDLLDPEPVPADHPVLQRSNVILAPHIASASPAAVNTLRQTAAGLALKAVRGEPLPNIVNGVNA